MSDILVVYYSRTGKTRMVAERLAALLGADLDEIAEEKDRSGVLGFIVAGKDAVLKKAVRLTHLPDPAEYKTILIGMPIWAGRPCAPARAYIEQTDLTGKMICVFCTGDVSKGAGVFNAVGALLPAPPATRFLWLKPKVGDAALEEALKVWAEEVRVLAANTA